MASSALAYLPAAGPEDLLKACLLPGREAIEAWERWKSGVSMDDADYSSQRLLPLLCENLRAQGVAHTALSRYRSVHRYVWFENQVHTRAALQALAALERASIPFLVLKGLALLQLYYGHPALRPMDGLDILVPPAAVGQALAVLGQAGWQPDPRTARSKPWENPLAAVKAVSLKDGQWRTLELSWHLQREYSRSGLDPGCWSDSQAMEIQGQHLKTLSHAHHLIHACILGARWNPVHPFRWVADSVLILRRAEVDWAKLVQAAQAGHAVLPVHDALRYIKTNFGCKVPDEILAVLKTTPVSAGERFEYRALQFARPYPPLVAFRMHRRLYRHLAGGRPSFTGFFIYLKAQLGSASTAALLLQLARRSLPRVVRHVFR